MGEQILGEPFTAKGTIDVLTPYKLSIVVLIKHYLKTKCGLYRQSPKHQAQARRKCCVFILKLIQKPDKTYLDLHNDLVSFSCFEKEIIDNFQESMRKLVCGGTEFVFNLFDSQTSKDKFMSENTRLSQHGVISIYIRRVAIILDKMTFPEVKSLSMNLKYYFDKSMQLPNVYPAKGSSKFERWSQKQAELFISQQYYYLEEKEEHALQPSMLQANIKAIIEDIPSLSQAHFLTYMNYVRLRDVLGAEDSLYKTFDGNCLQPAITSEIRGFQYAALHQAIYHAIFNHKFVAKGCLRECATISKHVEDRHCLEQSNAWHCLLQCESLEPSETYISGGAALFFMQPSALNVQFIAKIAGLRGFKPTLVLNAFMRSDELNCPNSSTELAINSIVSRAALWALHGETRICSLYAQMLLELNTTWLFSQVCINESICKAFCMLAMVFGAQGEHSLAEIVFQNAKLHFKRDPLAKMLLSCRVGTSLTRAVRKHRWHRSLETCHLNTILKRFPGLILKTYSLVERGNLIAVVKRMFSLRQKCDSLVYVRSSLLLSCSGLKRSLVLTKRMRFLTAALCKSRRRRFQQDSALIAMLYSQILHAMLMTQRALRITSACLENILCHGNLYEQTEKSLIFVKIMISEANTSEGKLDKMGRCIGIIRRSVECLQRLEAHSYVKAVYVYVALFYSEMGIISKRNKYSYLFKQYDLHFPASMEYTQYF